MFAKKNSVENLFCQNKNFQKNLLKKKVANKDFAEKNFSKKIFIEKKILGNKQIFANIFLKIYSAKKKIDNSFLLKMFFFVERAILGGNTTCTQPLKLRFGI